ncbi:translocation and assembly module TamB [Dyella sp. SG562]|uniref:translocation/assembly module TamB domain-containing protein n=1 Tax=Dyella sp. SG562 TaxID=2587017 RepID=UPI0014205503|nr:translocation/assembly module TamB domain-containing protein [Dyella sp. SG562]NII74259.1 translocation and assembly module TamB [Dyella sp. SG562]
MAKWLKRIGIFLGIVVLLLAVALWWLLGSASGLRFALARAQAFTDGALTVQQADGHLAGPLQLKGLRYADGQGMEVKVASATLDLRLWPLLRKRAHVLNLDADGIEVALPKPKEEEKPGESSFSLKPPLDIVLDRVHVGAVRIAQAGEPLFVSNRLDLAGQWTSAGIELHQLNLLAPDGHADLNGKLVIAAGEQGDGAAGFAWKVAGVEYAGSIEAHGDGKRIKTELKLTQPTALQLTVDAAQRGDYDWNARLDAPRFDPKPLLGDSSLTALGLALQGSGDRHGGTLQGKVDLNDYQLLLQPLSARFSDDFKTLQLQKLTLGSPQIKGQLEANGTVQLGAQPVSGDLTIAWKDLLLPASLAGQDLASQGSLKARGSADAFHAEGDVDVGPPGKLAKLALNLDGTPKLITLHTLELKQPQGGMQAKGTLTLQPALAWQLEATANKLDPGQLLAGWNGALDFDIATDGTLPQNQPDATLDIRKLAGTLRDRPVRAQGKLHLTPQQVVDGKLDLASGGSTVKLDAKPGASNDAQLDLAIASLGDWLPDAQGRVQGDLRLRGKAPKFSLDARLQGNGIAYAGQTVDSLHLNASLPDLSNPGGQLDLETGAARLGGLDFKRIDLHGEGSSARHSLTLQASGQQLSTRVALSGGMKGSAWNGTLSTLDLEPQGIPRWHLQQPSQLGYDNGAMSLSELCLTAGEPQLCVAARQDKAGNLDANYRLRDLPLALLMTFAGPGMPIRADGTLGGSGSIRRNAAGALSGSASITSPRGTVTYVDRADQPLLSYNELALQAQLSPSSQNATLHAGLNDGGRVDGQVSINGAQQALGGQLELHLNNLKFIELFSNEVAEVKGAANGSFRFAGTVAQPLVSGQAAVTGFAAEVPSAGLKLSQGQLTVSTTDARQFLIGGSVQSGKGSLRIDGHAGVGEGATTAINVKGSQFTAADIPSAKVIISPDLQITQDAKGINVGGDVTLDTADIDVSRLPGAGATQASPDVVVVDQEQQAEKAKALPITASVKVDLGRKTHLVGFGLDGRLSGTLTVSERPGRATTGQGQITVDGIYKAYGQSLQIEQGRLLFASTPVDNPGLDIRAARKLNPNATIDEGQKVGLMVSGTAQRPVLTVFSNPVMEQSDALSYLITGKPLSQVKGGEGDMVGAAAQALGSAAGDLLAKSVGSKLGIDDVGVSSNEALGGTSAFTVGKFLSPRLYLSYGVGLFEPGQVVTLRYRLSHRWNFEAQSATDFNRASLNYRLEK